MEVRAIPKPGDKVNFDDVLDKLIDHAVAKNPLTYPDEIFKSVILGNWANTETLCEVWPKRTPVIEQIETFANRMTALFGSRYIEFNSSPNEAILLLANPYSSAWNSALMIARTTNKYILAKSSVASNAKDVVLKGLAHTEAGNFAAAIDELDVAILLAADDYYEKSIALIDNDKNKAWAHSSLKFIDKAMDCLNKSLIDFKYSSNTYTPEKSLRIAQIQAVFREKFCLHRFSLHQFLDINNDITRSDEQTIIALSATRRTPPNAVDKQSLTTLESAWRSENISNQEKFSTGVKLLKLKKIKPQITHEHSETKASTEKHELKQVDEPSLFSLIRLFLTDTSISSSEACAASLFELLMMPSLENKLRKVLLFSNKEMQVLLYQLEYMPSFRQIQEKAIWYGFLYPWTLIGSCFAGVNTKNGFRFFKPSTQEETVKRLKIKLLDSDEDNLPSILNLSNNDLKDRDPELWSKLNVMLGIETKKGLKHVP
ncbi:MAG: hypothetical protein ABI597_05865 [Gammaproteobacteria bacterium]